MQQLVLFDSVCEFEGCEEAYKPHHNRKHPMCERHVKVMRMRQWRAENAQESRRRVKAYQEANAEAVAERKRRYAQENDDKIRAYQAEYRRVHGDKKRAYFRDYNQTPKRVAARRAWAQSPHGRLVRRAIDQQRRARARSAAGFSSAVDIAARMEFYGWKCWMCGADAESIDHVIPLARGGSNWPSNLRPACKSCNSAKGARPWRDYIPQKEAA